MSPVVGAVVTFLLGGGLVRLLDWWRGFRRDRITDLKDEIRTLREEVRSLNDKLQQVLDERLALKEQNSLLRTQLAATELTVVELAEERDAWERRAVTAEGLLLSSRAKPGEA